MKYDSTFAMAYLRLGGYTDGEEYKKTMAKAVEYSDRVSQKERHFIKASEAFASGGRNKYIKELQKIVERYPEEKEALLGLGSYYAQSRLFEQAIFYYNKAIEIDPLYKLVYNKLAYTYNDMGDFEKSIWAINKYISLAPDEANPYDTRADLYAYNGKLDQAIASYKKALEIKPDFYMSLEKLGHMYLFKREYPKAESCYKALFASNDKDYRALGRTLLALIPLYQGKFEDALNVLDDGIAADRMEQAEWNLLGKHICKSVVYKEKDLNLAVKEVEKCIEIIHRLYPDDKLSWRHYYVLVLPENRDFERTQQVAKALKKDIEEFIEEKKGTKIWWFYWSVVGWIELSKSNLKASVANFEKLVEADPVFPNRFLLAKAYLEAGRLGEAVVELEKVITSYDEYRAYSTVSNVKAYYLLGLAYEKSGWNKKAIEKYEEFLDIWKEADPGIEEVEDAKERLKRLKSRQ